MIRAFILYLLYGFLLSPGATSVAQAQFNALPDSNAQWHMYLYNGPTVIGDDLLFVTDPSSDTTINGMEFSKLHREGSSQLVGALRTNGSGKVWYYSFFDNMSFLLYDFAVNVGDTVHDVFTLGSSVTMRVDVIDTITIAGGISRKRIGISQIGAANPALDHWIEGIGGTGGLLTTCGCASISGSTELECMSANDSIMYGANAGQPGDCFLVTEVQEQVLPSSLSIHPNPSATGQFRLQLTDGADKIDRVEVFNLLGARQAHHVECSTDGSCLMNIPEVTGLFIVKITTELGATLIQKIQVQ